MDKKQTIFLTGNFSDYTIPPREIIEKYSDSLLCDLDFPNHAYGEMVLKTIEEFITKYPELENLYISKQRCLYKLCGKGFITSFFTKSNEAEATYLSIAYEFALAHPEIPLLAWYVAAHIYSHSFTSIATSKNTRKKTIEFYKTMLEKLPGNKYVLEYYTKAINSQISESSIAETEKEEYINILLNLSVSANEEDAIVSKCYSFLSLLYKERNPEKRNKHFHAIKMMYEENKNIDQLVVLYDFALMDCLVNDSHDNQIYIYLLDELINAHPNIHDLLGAHYWEMNYENIKCDSMSKTYYFENINEAFKLFPDFSAFWAIHRDALVHIIGFNGNTSYRDPALIILKDMMKAQPENNDIKKCYAHGLYYKSSRCNSIEEKIIFLNEIKILYEKTNLPDIAGYYCLGIQYMFNQERNKMTKDQIEMYFHIVESYYEQYQDNEIIVEAYVVYLQTLLWANILNWNKNLKDGENKYPKLEKDYSHYFNILYSLAHKFHNNKKIVVSYSYICDEMVESIKDMDILKKIYDTAVVFSEKYPNDVGDITYNCNEILTKLYKMFDDPEMKLNCLKEIKRIISNYYEDRSYWLTDFFEELYDDTDDHKEKENYLRMYIDYYNENPWNTNISWRYISKINSILQNTEDFNEKINLFSIINDWALRQPGNYNILEEYAESLLNVIYAAKNKPEYLSYKHAFIEFKEKFPVILSYIELAKNEKFIELFGNIEEVNE